MLLTAKKSRRRGNLNLSTNANSITIAMKRKNLMGASFFLLFFGPIIFFFLGGGPTFYLFYFFVVGGFQTHGHDNFIILVLLFKQISLRPELSSPPRLNTFKKQKKSLTVLFVNY